jgi:hypothetical protein
MEGIGKKLVERERGNETRHDAIIRKPSGGVRCRFD